VQKLQTNPGGAAAVVETLFLPLPRFPNREPLAKHTAANAHSCLQKNVNFLANTGKLAQVQRAFYNPHHPPKNQIGLGTLMF
jgi:hypothetical protein